MDSIKISTPIRSIREKCLDCCQSSNEIKLCTMDGKQSTWCPLFPYRFGRRPVGGKKRVMTEDQREKAIERLKKAREVKNKAEVSSCEGQFAP